MIRPTIIRFTRAPLDARRRLRTTEHVVHRRLGAINQELRRVNRRIEEETATRQDMDTMLSKTALFTSVCFCFSIIMLSR